MSRCTVCKQEIPDDKQLCNRCQTNKTQIALTESNVPIHRSVDLGIAGTIVIKNPA